MTITNGINYYNNVFVTSNIARPASVDFASFMPKFPFFDFSRFDWQNFSLKSFNIFPQISNSYSFRTPSYGFMPFNFNFDIQYQHSWNQTRTIFPQSIEQKPIVVGDTFIKSELPKIELPSSEIKSISLQLVDKAKSYLGKVNSDAEGNRLFSPNGKTQAWCADFVTYVVRDIYGNKLPSSFGSSAVSGLRDWGKKNNCYLAMPQQNKGSFIARNIQPGDVMILKENGRSHTGIVTKVNEDGSFETVEGNCGNKVKTVQYTASNPQLSGFVSLKSYA